MTLERNGVDLAFTRELSQRLAAIGIEVTKQETVIAFMANNRIRRAGELEGYHLKLARDELGAAFVLIGTVTQAKDTPAPCFGITLNLVRTYDGRTLWSYVGALSSADERRLLGLGEPKSPKDLQPLLADEIVARWPKDLVNQQRQNFTSIDALLLEPGHVRPGTEVRCTVRLRNVWTEGRAPRVFFKADEQLHAATFDPKTNAYEGSWIAGEREGRFPVALLLEWPLYGRSENLDLGSYVVDGVQPLIALDLRGERLHGTVPVFRDDVILVPRMLVRKRIARWRMTVRNSADVISVDEKGNGELPEQFIWHGQNSLGAQEADGAFQTTLEVWDESGNKASASARLELSRSAPKVEIVAEKQGANATVGLQGDDKVPLAFWRLEVWSEEGKLLTKAEGTELPAKVGVELPAEDGRRVEGVVVLQDVMGNRTRREVKDLFPTAPSGPAKKPAEKQTTTQTWVKDF